MTKKYYPDTDLDKKIPRKVNEKDAKIIKKKNFGQLCKYYHLDADDFDQNDPSPWRNLCVRIIEHRIAGFQLSKSGNKSVQSLAGDWEIYKQFCSPEREFGFDTRKREEVIKSICKAVGIDVDQAEAAIDRVRETLRKNPSAIYAPELAGGDLSAYETNAAAPDRYKKNRKNKMSAN